MKIEYIFVPDSEVTYEKISPSNNDSIEVYGYFLHTIKQNKLNKLRKSYRSLLKEVQKIVKKKGREIKDSKLVIKIETNDISGK